MLDEFQEKALALLLGSDKSGYQISKDTGITEATIGNYRNGKTKPTRANAGLLVDYFEGEKRGKPKGDAVPRSIRREDVTMAPLIGQYAYAGYLSGFGDPEYMDVQPVYYGKRKYTPGNYVAFEVSGESMTDGSMRSIQHGSLVLGRELYRTHWKNIRKGEVFIIIHCSEGICIKEVTTFDAEKGIIKCHSWNPEYEDYDVFLDDVLQLFYVKEVSRSM